jgi:hypothetical protein
MKPLKMMIVLMALLLFGLVVVAIRGLLWVRKADELVHRPTSVDLDEVIGVLGQPERAVDGDEESQGMSSCTAFSTQCRTAYWYGPPIPGLPMQWMFGADALGKIVVKQKIDSPGAGGPGGRLRRDVRRQRRRRPLSSAT